MKLSFILLAFCIAYTSAQTSYASCVTASWTNFWTFFWNPFFANFGSGVTSPTTCQNLVNWITYLVTYYGWGGSGWTATCTAATAGADANGRCQNGLICVSRPPASTFSCTTTAPAFTDVRAAATAMFTGAAPTAAPVAGCYCPYLNIPSAMTNNYLANLNAWWAASAYNPAGYFSALYTNGSNPTNYYCAAITQCPSGSFSYVVSSGW